MKLFEAATIRSRARAAAKALKDLLADKTLPHTLRKQVESLDQALSKTWKDLEADAQTDPEPKPAKEAAVLDEAASIGTWFEARLHAIFTQYADDWYGSGYLSRDERKALSHAIGQALDAFIATVEETMPELYQRRPWTYPEHDPAVIVTGEAKEAASDIEGGFIPLVEKAVRKDGTIPVKIIQPGWGSSGYYPAEVLERDGPAVFTRGLKMFWNHQTPQEEAQRPEGDLRDLAAELVSDAKWQGDHPAGPGLYADAKVFEGYQPAVDDLAPHIGVSIRARGKAAPGMADGKSGPIIQAITAAKSVDFVTSPGAGGQILQLFEARRGAAQPSNVLEKGDDMDAKELEALKEANAQLSQTVQEQSEMLARLREGALLREAGEFVAVELAAVDLPQITKSRLLRDLAKNPPVVNGALDREAYTTLIAEAVKAERAYLVEVTGGGRITGMGGGSRPDNDEASHKALVESFMLTGLSREAAEIAAAGR